MKKKLTLILAFFILHTLSWAQNLITNPGFETGATFPYILWYSDASYSTVMSVTTQNPHSGNNALLLDVQQTDPTNTNYYDKIWRVQCTQSGFSTTQGEEILISFWARADTVHPMQFGITKNSSPYTEYSMEEVDVTTEWQKYEMVFISPVTGTDIRLMFYCGSSVGQYYIDDISLTNAGMSDVNWYANADQRIEQIRKDNFVLTVKDADGNLLTNCDVTVTLKQHDFKWGTALSFDNTISADETWYRNTALTYFNNAVFENAFKWPSMEYSNGIVDYTDVQRYLDWGTENRIDFRGHNLVWGGKQAAPPNNYWLTPSWLWNVSSDSAYTLIERRVKRELTYYKGKIFEYDVVNEAIHEEALADWLGDSVNVMAYKWAKEADPEAALYINDYANIDGSTTSKYKSYISHLLSKGAPVEGIGIQGHFGTLIDWPTVKLRLDYLGDLGLPLKITEFDMNVPAIGMTEAQQASQYAMMMRIAFSHPDVEAFLFWGFWDARHWIPGAGIFAVDKTAKPAADSVYNLIHTTWSTTATLKTDQNGQIAFRGFYGTYDVRAVGCVPGKSAEADFTRNTLQDTVELATVITGIINSSAAFSLVLYPNPAVSKATVVLSSNENSAAEYVIMNATGQIVKRKSALLSMGENTLELDIQDLKSGVYEFQINVDGKSYTSKLIKSE